jgi:hypothetical protein
MILPIHLSQQFTAVLSIPLLDQSLYFSDPLHAATTIADPSQHTEVTKFPFVSVDREPR